MKIREEKPVGVVLLIPIAIVVIFIALPILHCWGR